MAARKASPHNGGTAQPVSPPPRPGPAEGRLVRFRAQDGLSLALRIFGEPGDRLPLLCLPGLSRNSRDFLALGRFFANHPETPRRVVAVDYRGRGHSDSDPDWGNYTPLVEAQDVIAAAAMLGIEEAIIVGTSRGGIIAMILGALRPALIAGVVLNDIGPVIDARGLARIKRYLTAGTKPAASWEEAAAAVRAANEAQFPALSAEDWKAFAHAYFTETRAGLLPQFDPDLKKAIVDLDLSERVPVLWPQFASLARVPLFAIRGEHSDILSAATLDAMAARHPAFEDLTVEGQGHAPLLRDAPTLERLFAFAARCDQAKPT